MAKYKKEVVKNEKVEFIHMSLDRADAPALKWAKDAKLPWLHVLPEKVTSLGFKKFHTERYVPFYCLVDKDGKVLAQGKDASFKEAGKLSK